MIWLALAIISYFLSATVRVVDKYLLSSKGGNNPLAYSFYGGILTSFAFVLWPLDFAFLSFGLTALAVFSGVCFFVAVYFMYSAMAKGETSRVISFIGGISPLIVLGLSYFILNERLAAHWVIAFILLLSGSYFLASEKKKKNSEIKINKKLSFYAVCAAVFFALAFFSTKLVYAGSPTFLNGFIWVRVGTVLAICFILLFKSARRSIFENKINISGGISLAFVSNKALGALAFVILNYAVKIGSVSVISALEGVEYAFVFLFALTLHYLKPNVMKESFERANAMHKIAGILLVSSGIALLIIF